MNRGNIVGKSRLVNGGENDCEHLFRVAMPLTAKNRVFKALHEYYRTRHVNPLTDPIQ